MTKAKMRSVAAIAGLTLAAASLTGSPAGVAQGAATKTISLKNISYTPSNVTVSRGGKVRWVWRDGSIRHDVRFSNGGLRPSRLQSTGSYSLTFARKGTYRFFCSVHLGDMKGRVTVR